MTGGASHQPSRLLVAVLVAAVLGALVWWRVLPGRGEPDEAGSPPVVAEQGRAALVASPAPTQPVRLPDPGAFVDARVQPDGTVQVTHWLRAPEAVDEVSLRTYPPLQVPGPTTLTDLEIRTSQGEVRLPDVPEVGVEPVTVPLVRPTLLVRLAYTLRGVTVESGDEPGRALVDSVLADVDLALERGETRVQVGGRRILQLTCVQDGGTVLDVALCGSNREGGWAVNLTPRQKDTKVVAQVELDQRPERNPDRPIG